MTLRRIVLADAAVLIGLVKLNFPSLLQHLSQHYNWDINITKNVEDECKDLVTASLVRSMIRNKSIRILYESSFEVANNIKELDKRMEPGAEIELFAIAKYRKYDILTDDLSNTNVYFRNYPMDRGQFWVYNLYHLLYLAYKARILSLGDIELSLRESHKSGIRTLSKYILEHNFQEYCERIDEYIEHHIDPIDTNKFLL